MIPPSYTLHAVNRPWSDDQPIDQATDHWSFPSAYDPSTGLSFGRETEEAGPPTLIDELLQELADGPPWPADQGAVSLNFPFSRPFNQRTVSGQT